MNKGILITLPRHEYTVDYLSASSKRILQEAIKKNIKVKELKDKNANRKEFESFIKSLDYKLIILNGHGSEDTISGHKNIPIIKKGVNDSLLKERITYARSCWAGAKLGQCMKDDKKGCFIGYNLPFMFYINDTWRANPQKDKIAPIFLEPSNLVPISLIKGNTSSQAHEKSKKQMLKNIKKILRERSKESLLFAFRLHQTLIQQLLILLFFAFYTTCFFFKSIYLILF